MTSSKDPQSSQLQKDFGHVSNARGLFDLLVHYVGIAVLVAIAVNMHNWAVSLVAIILIGGLQHGLSSLQHDGWHYLCFKPHKLNDFVSAWFYTYPLGGFFYYNQVRHRGHHAYFATMKDPDRETYINVGKSTPGEFIRYYLYVLVGGFIFEKVRAVINTKSTELPGMDLCSKNMPDRKQELLCIGVSQLVLIAVYTFTTGSFWSFWLYWFLPLVTLASLLGSWRQTIEHANASGDDLPPEERLFEFAPNAIERFFFSPINFQYHAFHHAFPKIPHYRLKEAKAEAAKRGMKYISTQRKGYIAETIEHLRRLKSRPPQTQPVGAQKLTQ